MKIISPEIKVLVKRPIDFDGSEYFEIPIEYISNINSIRAFNGGSIEIQFVDTDSYFQKLDYKNIFNEIPEGSILFLYARISPKNLFKQFNAGIVSTKNYHISSAQNNWQIQCKSILDKLRESEVFIDLSVDPIKIPSKITGSQIQDYITKISSLSKADKITKLFEIIWNDLFVALGNVVNIPLIPEHLKSTIELQVDSKSNILEAGIYPFQYIMQNSTIIGRAPSPIDILENVSTPPLYEFFIDELEGEGDLGIVSNFNPFTFDIKKYNVNNKKVSFVFRITPFSKIFNSDGSTRSDLIDYEIEEIFDIEYTTNEIFSGIHIGLMSIEDKDNTILFPPIFNNILRRNYGHKLLNIRIDGLRVPEDNPKNQNQRNDIKTHLRQVQEQLYNYFCKYVRNVSCNLSIPFDFYRLGSVVKFPQFFKEYGNIGYIETITDSFNNSGQAKTTLNIKWIDNLSILK